MRISLKLGDMFTVLVVASVLTAVVAVVSEGDVYALADEVGQGVVASTSNDAATSHRRADSSAHFLGFQEPSPMPVKEEEPTPEEGDELLLVEDPPKEEEKQPPAEEKAPDENELLLEEDELLTEEDDLLVEDDLLEGDDLLLEDDLLGDDSLLTEDELLTGEDAVEQGAEVSTVSSHSSAEAHGDLFLENRYPSAATCATCHPKHYREWSVSQHGYAQLSPIFNAMQNVVNVLTSTTNGDFCLRCHTPIGSELGEPFSMSNLDRHPASREGITCITCHRVSQAYGKVSGRIAFEQGDIFSKIYGPTGNEELERVLDNRQQYRVVTSAEESGRGIHTEVERFFPLVTPGFCATCHEVTLVNGFRLEEAFSDYKHSPAAKKGVTCNDCHMGTVEGVASDYAHGPAAVVGDVPTQDRKLTSHYFAGPDSPIVHPGIFPHNVWATQFKSLHEWLEFDVNAGWGTDEFEDSIGDDVTFPEAWKSIDDRYDAREIINEQLELLQWAKGKRLEVMRNGFELGDVEVKKANRDGITFKVDVRNATDGHQVPTGFDAERLVFLEVTVTDSEGTTVFQSGDRDPNGDVRDSHSAYVLNGEVPRDKFLMSLQSTFLTRLARGGEREQVLPVNTSVSALPFVRPEDRPTILYGRPRGARKHRKSIEPGGRRVATYKISTQDLTGHEPYHATVKLRYQAVPVNLISAIQSVGFNYGMSAREVADAVVAGGDVIWQKQTEIHLEQ